MKKLLFISLILVVLTEPLFSLESPDLKKFIEGFASVKSFKGSITQHIYTGSSVEKMTGDYSAVSDGFFRIDYTYPERQTVINNSSGLYWYYPEREIVFFRAKNNSEYSDAGFLPGNGAAENLSGVNVAYQGIRLYRLFQYAHVYSFKSDGTGNTVVVWFDSGGRFVLRKYVADDSGREILKEEYHEHLLAGDAYIPSKIELFIRTADGVIHTMTGYSNVTVNSEIDRRIFEFHITKNMTLRRFNEAR